MISPDTFEFLRALKENNNKEWFNAHKPRYQQARTDFESFVGDLILGIAQFDPDLGELDAKRSVFRIYRDTRFSPDKTPYKTNLGAHLVVHHQKLHDRAGYYIHIEPGNCFLAGGAYMPPSAWLRSIRATIDVRGDKLKAILGNPGFKNTFGEMRGERLKTKPREYSLDHPHIELLKYKSFLAMHPIEDELAQSQHFLEHAIHVFSVLKPFNDFLNASPENS